MKVSGRPSAIFYLILILIFSYVMHELEGAVYVNLCDPCHLAHIPRCRVQNNCLCRVILSIVANLLVARILF